MQNILCAMLLVCLSTCATSCSESIEISGNSQKGGPATFQYIDALPRQYKKRPMITYGQAIINDYSQKITTSPFKTLYTAAETFVIHVMVINTGKENWPVKRPVAPLRQDESRFEDHEYGLFPIQIGYRWIDKSGKLASKKDFFLPHDIPSGQNIELALPIESPNIPGVYSLLITMLQRKIGDFSERGGDKFSISLTIE
jgi:hypothetical protein